jgi:hypothetical protein
MGCRANSGAYAEGVGGKAINLLAGSGRFLHSGDFQVLLVARATEITVTRGCSALFANSWPSSTVH